MLKEIERLMERLQTARPDVSKEMVSEWFDHPVTKSWMMEALRLYESNLELLSEYTPVDDLARGKHAKAIGENNILEQFLNFEPETTDEL